MTELPILFSGPLVRAILDGRKFQTRRPVKHPLLINADRFAFDPKRGEWEMGECHQGPTAHVGWMRCPFGVPGDRLWVRETFAQVVPLASGRLEYDGARMVESPDGPRELWYRADGELGIMARMFDDGPRWTPSIHMPRWASRLMLEVTGVRVERLQAISDVDVRAEGVLPEGASVDPVGLTAACGQEHFRPAWDAAYGAGAWDANPWVWVVQFKRVESQ